MSSFSATYGKTCPSLFLGPKLAFHNVRRTAIVRVAMPRFGEMIAPCFGYSATITIFTIRRGKVVDDVDFCLQSTNILDRVRLLRDQKVNTLICGGLQERLEDILKTNGVRVISWVSGRVDELLDCFMRGELVAGAACMGNRKEETCRGGR
jgi:predicted Fe-Mo cluster-binding NifX family protein